ncbi:MAG: urease accessory protein UreD [Pseudomonadota bacterium]
MLAPAPDIAPTDKGWAAYLRLGFRESHGKTVLATRERHGPLTLQRPLYPEGDICHLYLLHPPGGIVGGDLLNIDATVEDRARALVTTPGATKFYRSAGSEAIQHQSLKIQGGASLEWLPQENIFFPGAHAKLITRIDLAESAKLAWWEIHCFGRPVINEVFDEGAIDSSLMIQRAEKPCVIERLRVSHENRKRLSLLCGHAVSGTAVFSSSSAEHIDIAREVIASELYTKAGATLIDDLLVLRYLGDSTEDAKRIFSGVWNALREPLLRRVPHTPRIWNT